MNFIPFFKFEAKILLKDYKTRYYDESRKVYRYQFHHFDIGDLFFHFEFPDHEDNFTFTLQNAQHLIAKMVGYNKWEDLIHASEIEHELSEYLLKKFRNSHDIQDWEDAKSFSGIEQYGAKATLEYAHQYYELSERSSIVNLTDDKIEILSGKERRKELIQFDDEHNPAGQLRLDSVVFCNHCKKAFDFSKSKVIKDKETDRKMVVCKNYPDCKCTYLDFKVLTPTILYSDTKDQILKKGLREQVISIPSSGLFRMKLDSKVRCQHCGDEFTYQNAKVILSPDWDGPSIHCKNYPECDGELMDLIGFDDLLPIDKE